MVRGRHQSGRHVWRWRYSVWAVLGFCMTLWLALGLAKPAMSLPRGFENHWSTPCLQGLERQGILDPAGLRATSPEGPITQGQFAEAVLRAFPGRFAAANEALGLTFDAPTEMGDLLLAALENRAQSGQRLLRSQALSILVTGAAIPYQANANQLLQAHFRDQRLIPFTNREGVAAALAQGFVISSSNSTSNLQMLAPSRPTSLAEAGALLCVASPQANLAATVPADRRVRFQAQTPTAAPTRELRGVWLTNIDSQVLFSRERLQSALQTLASARFNTVYPTVWNWGYTLYPSLVAERTLGHRQGLYPDLDDTGRRNEALEAAQGSRDMLKEAIEIAHPLGLKVIPWFEFGFMAPADSELARRHPEWLTRKSDGSIVTPEGTHPRAWLNPFHPEVQQFMLAMIGELMANYDVDGFQVDDHFGLPVAYGYDPYTVRLYQQEHNGQSPPTNPQDAEWLRWRAAKITDFVRQMFQVVKARRPRAVMSVSPNPQEFAYTHYLQDWQSWVNRGYVEELVIQLYRSDLGRFVWELDRAPAQAARQHIPTGIGVLSGLRNRPVPMSRIREQVVALRDRNYAGVAFFFYESLWWSDTETPAQRLQQLQQLFPAVANRPGV
jgi:uncharacterized lipoprotein YddW (UPF0748 family)